MDVWRDGWQIRLYVEPRRRCLKIGNVVFDVGLADVLQRFHAKERLIRRSTASKRPDANRKGARKLASVARGDIVGLWTFASPVLALLNTADPIADVP